MSPSSVEYAKMFGEIRDGVHTMARCACVACNSCTCACACRATPKSDEIEW